MADVRLDPLRKSLNKWEMHKALQEMKLSHANLPETQLGSIDTIVSFIHRHPQIFLKPLGTWGGQQISRVTRQDASAFLCETTGSLCRTFATEPDLLTYVTALYTETPYIVQQAAPLRKLHGRTFDIRLLLQRDLDDTWIPAGSVVRVGGADSFVSNVEISGGKVIDTDRLFPALRIKGEAKSRIVHNLSQCGLAICNALNQYYAFDEVGIDFGLGTGNGLWIIEVNTNDALGGPSHELFRQLPNDKLYREISDRFAARNAETVRLLFEELF